MLIKIKPYNTTLLHEGLTPLQELVLLYIIHDPEPECVYIEDIAGNFCLSRQYTTRILKTLTDAGYLERKRGYISLIAGTTNKKTLPESFLYDDTMSTEHKKAIIDLYSKCRGLFRINTEKLKMEEPLKTTLEVIEIIEDQGYMLIEEELDFKRVFNNKSRYDD